MKGAVRETLAPNYANMQAPEPSALIGCGIARCKVNSGKEACGAPLQIGIRDKRCWEAGVDKRFPQETLYTCIELSDYLLFLSNRERCCGVAQTAAQFAWVVVAGDDNRRYRGPDGGFREITGDSIVVVWLTPEKGDGVLGFFVSEFLAFERANNAQEFRGIGMTADRNQHATNRADCASAIFTAPFNRR